jgi:hypothetical protein
MRLQFPSFASRHSSNKALGKGQAAAFVRLLYPFLSVVYYVILSFTHTLKAASHMITSMLSLIWAEKEQ